MKQNRSRLYIFLLLQLICVPVFAQQEQPYNRFQFHTYQWQVLKTDAFNIYYSKGTDTLCNYLKSILPTAIAKVKKNMLEDVMRSPNIIIYPSIDQLYESNIGSYELQQYTFPTFVSKASRILLAYNGSYTELEGQTYEALARYEWETQIPIGVKEQAKSKKDEVPFWFKEGAIKYFAHNWPITAEQTFSRSFEDKPFNNWLEIQAYEPRLAGQAFCYYLSMHYQKKVVAQAYFQLKKGKSLPRAIRLVTKHTLDSLQNQCFAFYKQRFELKTEKTTQTPITITHKKGIVQQVVISPDKHYIAYVCTRYSNRTVYIYDINTKRTKKINIYQLPPWLDDHSKDQYPLLELNNNDLNIAIPIKGKICIRQYDVNGKLRNTDKLKGADGIYHFETTTTNNTYHLAAYRKGQNGNVSYNTNTDKYSLGTTTGKALMADFKTINDSIYIYNQIEKEWIDKNKQYPIDTPKAWLKDYLTIKREQAKEDSILKKAKDTTYYFLDDVFAASQKNKKSNKDTTKKKTTEKAEPYVLQLHSAYFSAKVNNDYLINRYQPFLNYQGSFKFPEVSGMAQGGFADLFENHHFSMAYAIPSGTEGSDFFAKYENTAKKLDWGLMYYRKVASIQPDQNRNWTDENGNPYPNTAKVKTHYYELSFHYPLSYYASIDFQQAIRQDKTVFLATDKYSLDFNPIQSAWSITTLSYTLNKLKPTLPYLFKGFKANATMDVFKGFTQQEATVLGTTLNLSFHQPLYKYITLVTQLHTGYSGGDQKVLYNLGGTDNNVTPRVDTTVHFKQTAPYAFQTLVTPFRGYYQNSLYGNEYLLFNADIYFPIFQTLIPIETALPSINNLQLGIFTDAATAKETWQSNPNNGKWKQSYGLSARTSLAGYPIRVDVAWPGFSKQAVLYFSLSLK